MEKISRKEALAAGRKLYYTGNPCVRGHIAPRRVREGACLICSQENCRKWKLDNKDKVKKYNENYWTEGRDGLRSSWELWRSRHQDKNSDYANDWKDKVESLSDGYVKQLLIQGMKHAPTQIPEDLLEAKRVQLLIKRHLKEVVK